MALLVLLLTVFIGATSPLDVGIKGNTKLLYGTNDDGVPSGYIVDVLSLLDKRLGLGVVLHDQSEQTWDEVINSTQAEMFDLAASTFSITKERFDAGVLFTYPILLGSKKLLMKGDTQDSFMLVFSPFDSAVWALLIFYTFAIATGLWLAELNNSKYENRASFGEHLFYCCSIPFGSPQAHPARPTARAAACIWSFSFTVVVALYTAKLASVLTVHRHVALISSIEDLGGDDTIAVKDGTAHLEFAKRNRLNTLVVKDPEAAINAVKTGMAVAYLASSSEMVLHTRQDCSLVTSPPFDHQPTYFALPNKHVDLNRRISGALIDLEEEGTLQDLQQLWLKDQRWKCSTETDKFTFKSLEAVFVLFTVGFVLCLCTWVYYRCSMNFTVPKWVKYIPNCVHLLVRKKYYPEQEASDSVSQTEEPDITQHPLVKTMSDLLQEVKVVINERNEINEEEELLSNNSIPRIIVQN